MKERTKQFNVPITKVFDFDFSDFQPEISNTAIISLDFIQKRTAIYYAQIKNSIPFAGPGITEAKAFLGETSVFTPLTNLSAAFINFDLTTPVSDTSGAARSIPLRPLPSNPNASPIIVNHNQATELFLILQVDPGQSINDLIAGEATIWFSFIRLR